MYLYTLKSCKWCGEGKNFDFSIEQCTQLGSWVHYPKEKIPDTVEISQLVVCMSTILPLKKRAKKEEDSPASPKAQK